MLVAIILVIIGIYIENRFSPRLAAKNNTLYVNYKPERGAVKKEQKLFSY